MPNPNFKGDSPPYLITEPLRSISPEILSNGDLRMAIATVGQGAYTATGEKKILSEEFLSNDYFTWENGLVSTNHENTNSFLGGATLYDLKYDPEKKLVFASFGDLPVKARRLIDSEFYHGLSQECKPSKYREGTNEVISGVGTGVTIVMWPHNPAATPGMGVGVRPALAAILRSKYPIENQPQIEDYMTDKPGGGTPAISTEAYEVIVSEKAELKSRLVTLETDNKKLGEELASTRTEFESYKTGEVDRTNLAYSKGKEDGRTEFVTESDRLSAIEEFTQAHGKDFAKSFMSTNPSIEQIKMLTSKKTVEQSKEVGSSQVVGNEEVGKSYDELNSAWKAKLGRA